MNSNRREFLQQGTALAAAAASPWLANLAAISEAAAQTGPRDYKALVCVFLWGGNDHANTIVPLDTANFNSYKQQRPALYHHLDSFKMGTDSKLPGTGLEQRLKFAKDMPLNTPATTDGAQFGLSPVLTPLYQFYAPTDPRKPKKLAVLMNVGPLTEPTVVVKGFNGGPEYRKAALPTIGVKPPVRLFSHSDQTLIWQSSVPEGATEGWGGRIADIFVGTNSKPTFTAISVAGNTVLMTGRSSSAYQVTTSDSISVPLRALRKYVYGSSSVANALGQIMTGANTVSSTSHVFEQDLTSIIKRSISADNFIQSIPRSSKEYPLLDAISGNPLAAQLLTVAHLIKSFHGQQASTSSEPLCRRQVFYVTLGSFDTHSNQINQHANLLDQLAQALSAFQLTLDQLGLSDNVTTFTASEFGRTLNSNNDGTDHGWGGHQFILGGAVDGGKLYGTPPSYTVNGTRYVNGVLTQECLDRGSLVPTTSVDQFAATLAKWMGAPDVSMVVPSIRKYGGPGWPIDLKFMKSASTTVA